MSVRAEISQMFDRWTHIVAASRSGTTSVTATRYDQLRARLLEYCQQIMENESAGEAQQAREIYMVVQPWASLESLTQANKRILTEVHRTCRSIQQRYVGVATRIRTGAIALFLIVAAVAALVFVFAPAESFSMRSGLESMRVFLFRKTYAFTSQMDIWWYIGLGTLVLVSIGIFSLRRTRSY